MAFPVLMDTPGLGGLTPRGYLHLDGRTTRAAGEKLEGMLGESGRKKAS